MGKDKHIGIELNSSKHVHLTTKEFHNASVIGIASFFINHPVVFEQQKDHVRIYSQDYRIGHWMNHPRLKKFKAFTIKSIEIAYLVIPNTDPLRPILNHKFEKYFLREDDESENCV